MVSQLNLRSCWGACKTLPLHPVFTGEERHEMKSEIGEVRPLDNFGLPYETLGSPKKVGGDYTFFYVFMPEPSYDCVNRGDWGSYNSRFVDGSLLEDAEWYMYATSFESFLEYFQDALRVIALKHRANVYYSYQEIPCSYHYGLHWVLISINVSNVRNPRQLSNALCRELKRGFDRAHEARLTKWKEEEWLDTLKILG